MEDLLPNYFCFLKNDKEQHREKAWLNLNEKFITRFFLFLKMGKSNTEKKKPP